MTQRLPWVLLAFLVACGKHAAQPERHVHELHPIDRAEAIAIWSEEAGAHRAIGRIDNAGHASWSVDLVEDVSRFAVGLDAVFVETVSASEDTITAYAIGDGHRLWSQGISSDGTAAELRVANGALVLWTLHHLAILATKDGRVRFEESARFERPPAVQGRFVEFETDTSVASFALDTDHLSSIQTTAIGCATRDAYVQWTSGAFIARQLADLEHASTIAPTPGSDAWSVEQCASYAGQTVLISGVLGVDRHQRRELSFIENGAVVTSMKIADGFPPATVLAFHWRERAGLQGDLSRFVPIDVSSRDDSHDIRVFDLQSRKFVGAAKVFRDDTLVFSTETGIWLVVESGAHPELASIDGNSGALVSTRLTSEQLPAFEPNDVAGGVIWMPGPWSSSLAVARMDTASLMPIK